MLTESYDIHGSLAVRGNVELPIPDYFTEEEPTNRRTLVVEERRDLDTTVPPHARRLASHRFWFDDGTLTVRYPSIPFGTAPVVRLEGLGAEVTRLTFTPRFRSNADFKGLFEGVLTTKLLDAGLALVHAGAVVGGRGATILASMGRMGKTSTLLTLLAEDPDLGFMGDNVLLLDDAGTVYAWPATLGVFPGTAVTDDRLPKSSRLRVRIKRLVARSDLASATLLHKFSVDLSEAVSPEDLADEIVDTAPLDRLFVLNGGRPTGQGRRRSLDADGAAAKIATGTDMELDPDDYYLSLYSFVGDDRSVHPVRVKDRRREILLSALDDGRSQELFADDVEDYVSLID